MIASLPHHRHGGGGIWLVDRVDRCSQNVEKAHLRTVVFIKASFDQHLFLATIPSYFILIRGEFKGLLLHQ
jgi:hypothetical protein